jgi:ribosome-associated heat shock protein Hsp15
LDRQRIDKWLWHARVVRTRQAAAGLAAAGHVRVNGQRIDAPSRPVRPGDVVTVALDREVRVLRVVGFADRRGSADDARALVAPVEPAMPPAAPAPTQGVRGEGAGRPTKRDRRAMVRFTGDGDL